MVIFVNHLVAQVNRKICISVDDLPAVSYGIKNDVEISDGILKAFKVHSVPAIGYVNGAQFIAGASIDTMKVEILRDWLDAGMELGNHTFAHKNYHRVSFEEFAQDILDGEWVVKELVESYDQSYRFFRHPYLRSGADASATRQLKEFLTANGYQEAFVTVDDDDYLFALAYARAYRKSDIELMNKIGEAYMRYMVDKLKYFEKNSVELFGRNINHTLLIHASLLNATYLDRLLAAYKDLGYSFISQEEAINDPAYDTPVTKYGDWGVSWIDKWAVSAGKSDTFFADDPRVPAFVIELSR